MEGFMDRAPKEFTAALPMQKGTGARFQPPIPARKSSDMALRYARLVAGSRNFAAAASFAAKQKDTYDELCDHAEALQRRRDKGAEDRSRAAEVVAMRSSSCAPNSPPCCSARRKRTCCAAAAEPRKRRSLKRFTSLLLNGG